ncbi:hypothetical protein C8J56DRAFT_1115972 [Mycena floridula]|nr:hypothetical protein C8J56DRAFT_1115972 [Mycena floridula]
MAARSPAQSSPRSCVMLYKLQLPLPNNKARCLKALRSNFLLDASAQRTAATARNTSFSAAPIANTVFYNAFESCARWTRSPRKRHLRLHRCHHSIDAASPAQTPSLDYYALYESIQTWFLSHRVYDRSPTGTRIYLSTLRIHIRQRGTVSLEELKWSSIQALPLY